jgi:RHS repeat-associated protein
LSTAVANGTTRPAPPKVLRSRVAQQSTQSGTSTTTVYVGNLEEDSTTGTTTTKTTYYYADGSRIAMAVNGVFSYLASDGLGSANITLSSSGTATASMLYSPYGSARYSSGTMPTDYGFTGQHADANTGLDYYNARYYDPAAGQFASADTVLPANGFDVWGLSRFAYVEGNPIIRIDPTGNRIACMDDPTCGNAYGSGGPTGHANGRPLVSPPARVTPTSPDESSRPLATGSGQHASAPSTSNASPDQLGVEVARNYDSPRDPRYWQNLQLANLPVDGDYPYISPDKKSGRPVKLPGSQGYRDKVGDRWVWDPNKQEWDVQHRDGSHTNVGEDGRITHAQGDLSGVAVLGVVTIGVVGLLVAPEITIPALGITATGYAAEGA